MSEIVIQSEDFSQEEKKTLAAALAPLAVSDAPLVIEVALVGEEEILSLNASFRGKNSVTDVLSFPAMENIKGKALLKAEHALDVDENGNLFLGSIAICTARAHAQAQEYGHSYERELYYLAVHGVLHCLGYDHETDEEKGEMRAKEEEVMAALHLKRE